jgi:hypothetical protein
MILLTIMASIINIMTYNKIYAKYSTICVVELGLWRDYAQTKRNHYRPWCEDGAYALGLGVLAPHTMVWANAASRHGCGKKRK